MPRIKDLSYELRLTAIAEKKKIVGVLSGDRLSQFFEETLAGAFDWAGSSQGYKFWHDLNYNQGKKKIKLKLKIGTNVREKREIPEL